MRRVPRDNRWRAPSAMEREREREREREKTNDSLGKSKSKMRNEIFQVCSADRTERQLSFLLPSEYLSLRVYASE